MNNFSRQIFTWIYCIGRKGARADSNTKIPQPNNAIVWSVLGFFNKDIVLMLTFRHFRKCVLKYGFVESRVFSHFKINNILCQ